MPSVPRSAVAIFPGSFDPLTVAHLAIADAARAQGGVHRVALVLSELAIDKADGHTAVAARVEAIAAIAEAGRTWLEVRVTRHRLIADIAVGATACVVGADKWHQLRDLSYYRSTEHRDLALAALPRLLVAPRRGVPLPDPLPGDARLLDLDPVHLDVSSTAVRNGRDDWRA